MSGRRGGRIGGRNTGRGEITMTAAALNALISERVAEALAAQNPPQQNAGPNNNQGCTYKAFLDCKPTTFRGTEGAVGLIRWAEKTESIFYRCNCQPGDRVVYATGTLEDRALTWWNATTQTMGLQAANALTWDELKHLMREEYCPRSEVQKLENEFQNLKMEGSEIEAYTARSHDLAFLCPTLVDQPYKRIELYLKGLVPQIQSMVTSTAPITIQQAVRMAHVLTDQAVEQGTLPPRGCSSKPKDSDNHNNNNHNNKKRKYESNSSESYVPTPPTSQRRIDTARTNNTQPQGGQARGGYAGIHPMCSQCNRHHSGECSRPTCQRCGTYGHVAPDCRVKLAETPQPPQQQLEAPKGCFECGKLGHFKRDCPDLNNNNNNNNRAKGRVYVIGSGDAR